MDKATKDRLNEIRDSLRAKRAELVEASREKASAREAFTKKENLLDGDTKITDTQEFKDAQEAVAREGAIKDEINSQEEAEKLLLRMVDGDPTTPGHSARSGDEMSAGWDGHRLLAESEDFNQALQRGTFESTHKFGTVEMGRVCTREEFAQMFMGRPSAALPTAPGGTVGTDQGAIAPDVRGIIPPYLMPLTLLDLIPTGTTDSNIIQYVQVSAVPGSAAETAELAAKPQEGITLVDATAPVRTIAGWIKLARQAMGDIPMLATMINSLLPWDVRRRLMTQMLAGDGIGQNLTGILNTSGIGAPASASGDNIADGILRAMTTVVLSDADPNFVALNPLTWQGLAIMKSTGSGEYLYGGPGSVLGQTIWGMRMTVNRAIAQANPLVGDSNSATLLVREGVNIRTSDSDQDDFTKNRVTVLCECRVAFPVWRPTGFAKAPLG